jgi:hypothetical protein
MERRLGIGSFHDQTELPMPSVFLLMLLLVGGMKEIPDIDHPQSFLIQHSLAPEIGRARLRPGVLN